MLQTAFHAWERRLASATTDRVVRTFDWGFDWTPGETDLRAWVDRAERVGNLNYPDEARRRHIGGVVVINIGIRRDGTVERADIVQSSHIPILDEAALRIAKLAEPYPPLPKTAEDPDVLNVVRTGYSLNGRLLRPAAVIVSSGPAK